MQGGVEPSEAWSPVRPGALGQRGLQIPRAGTLCRDGNTRRLEAGPERAGHEEGTSSGRSGRVVVVV